MNSSDILNILDSLGYFAFILNKEHRVKNLNKHFLARFDLEEKELVGEKFEILKTKTDILKNLTSVIDITNELTYPLEFHSEAEEDIEWCSFRIQDESVKGFSILFVGKLPEAELVNKVSYLKNELNTILSSTPGNLYWKDIYGNYLGGNPSWLDLVGLKEIDEVKGRRDEDLFGEEKAGDLRKHDSEVMNSEQSIVYEESTRFRSGEVKYFMAAKMPRYDSSGKVIGIIGNSLDITELKDAQEQLKQSYQSKSQLMLNAIKEFRNPLNSISLLVDVLSYIKDPHKHTEIKEYIELIAKEVDALSNKMDIITEQIEYDSSAENTMNELHEFKIKWNIVSIIKEFQDKTICNGNDIYLKFTDNLPETIPIRNLLKVKDIFKTLINNAVRFTKNGFIFIQASLNDDKFRFEIHDTGIGIPLDRQQGLFDFYSDDPNPNSGIKLSSAKNYLDKIDAKISLNSSPGNGTMVIVDIPLECRLDTKLNDLKDYIDARGMIIDDNPVRSGFLTRFFDKKNITAIEPKELANVDWKKYDFILIDEAVNKGNIESIITKIPNELVPSLKVLTKENSLDALNIKLRVGSISLITKPLISDIFYKNLFRKIRIFAVEDDEISRIGLFANLKQLGCELDMETNLKDAKEALDKNLFCYDCILIDIYLPDGKGTELIDYIHENFSSNKDFPPLIAVTAHCTSSEQEKYVDLGIDDVVTKPVNRKKLMDIISSHILNKHCV